jgi:flagellar basal body P-ring formation protein FlgA
MTMRATIRNSQRRLFLATGVILVTLTGLTASAAWSQTSPARLRPIVNVDGDVVRLGDLFEGAGAASDVALFGAPAPGASGSISTTRIFTAARENGFIGADYRGLTSVTVKRSGRRIAADAIGAAIAARLASDHRLPSDTEVELNAGQMEAVVESSAGETIDIRSLTFNGASGRFEATYVVQGSRALELNPATVVGTVADVVRVPVLTRPVLKGDIVGQNDISVERRRRSEMGRDVLSSSSAIVGFAARRALPKGLVLREADLQRPEAIERNATVLMRFEQPGLQLTMRGRAQQAAAVGDTIQVQNITSKKIVEAIVTGPNEVRVTGVVLSQPPVARRATGTVQ